MPLMLSQIDSICLGQGPVGYRCMNRDEKLREDRPEDSGLGFQACASCRPQSYNHAHCRRSHLAVRHNPAEPSWTPIRFHRSFRVPECRNRQLSLLPASTNAQRLGSVRLHLLRESGTLHMISSRRLSPAPHITSRDLRIVAMHLRQTLGVECLLAFTRKNKRRLGYLSS